MTRETALPALSPAELAEAVDAVEEADLVAITLTDGDVLLGGILLPPALEAPEILVNFNRDEGRRHGYSHIVEVPPDVVAGLTGVPLTLEPGDPEIDWLRRILGAGMDEDVDLRIPPRDYPNPLESIISEHSLSVASAHGLAVSGYIQEALSRDAVPPEGIWFNDDVLLYVDWDFFLGETGGGLAVSAGIPGIVEIQKQSGPSLRSQVLQRVRGSLSGKIADEIRRRISPTMGEQVICGTLDVPESGQTTEVEGDECELVVACDVDSGESWAVLLKVGCLSYPNEFLPLVKSKLVVYGEMKPIPVRVMGSVYECVLLARAIAYLDEGE